jgi:hypothetical protein
MFEGFSFVSFLVVRKGIVEPHEKVQDCVTVLEISSQLDHFLER